MKSIKKFLCLFLSVVLLCTALGTDCLAFADEKSQNTESVTFGTYPQSQVTDSNLISSLNNQKLDWISYNYYTGKNSYDSMSQSDFMKYADLTYNGVKYRAVTFSQYRPEGSIFYASDTADAVQHKNGFEINTIYWFKYEPIKWIVLDEKTGLLLSADLLDAQSFSNTVYQKTGEYYNNSDCSVYANDYYTSSVRNWLNNDFYNCAFSDKEKTCIKTTTLNNASYSIDYNKYDSKESSDKVFLLSYSDVTNASYGFNSDKYVSDDLRIAKGSDYSKAQGLYVESISGAQSYSYWSLRTAGSESAFSARVSPNGIVSSNSYVYYSCYAGIRPAVQVNLKSCVVGFYEPRQCTHNYDAPKVTNPTCTANGKKEYSCTYCSYKYSEPIKALGHSYTSKVTAKATCTAKGKREYTCSRCSKKYSEPIKALGHKYKSKVVKPTYFDTGYTLHTCSQCKKSYKDKKTAKLKVKAPAQKKLSTKKKSIKVSWSKVKSVQGYEIQYSTDKNFKKNTKTIKINKGSSTSKTIKNLKKNKKYYVRVRAYKYQNKKYARSSWSKVKSIKVK